MFETWKVLRSTSLVHWIDALYWLSFTSIGGLVPLWGLLLLLPATNHPITMDAFSKNGEFALYSASFASASLYIILKEKPAWLKKLIEDKVIKLSDEEKQRDETKKDFPAKLLYVLGFVAILAATISLFSLVTLVNFPASNISMNIKFITNATLFVFFLSVALSYITTVVDNYLSSYEPEKELRISRRQDLEDVNSDFDSLKDK